MEKELPPSYTAATGNVDIGFNVPPNQGPPHEMRGYPPAPVGVPGQPPYGQQPAYPVPPMHQQAVGTTVIVTQVPMVAQFGPSSQPTTCPHCHHPITTRVDVEPGLKTHLIALLCCIFGCVPCCLIPYCVDSCQNRNHYCPSCGAFLGTCIADHIGGHYRY